MTIKRIEIKCKEPVIQFNIWAVVVGDLAIHPFFDEYDKPNQKAVIDRRYMSITHMPTGFFIAGPHRDKARLLFRALLECGVDWGSVTYPPTDEQNRIAAMTIEKWMREI